MQYNLDFSAGAPLSVRGFGVQQNTLSGGRTGVSLSHFGGLSEILWWGKKPEAAPSCFFAGNPASAYQRCFRAQLLVGDDPYNLEFARTSHFPFGYRSHFAVPEKGVAVIHRLTLLNNELVFSVEVKANASRFPLRLRFEHHEYSRKNAPVRQWSDWERSGGSDGWALVAEDRVPPEQWHEIEADARRQQEAFRSPGNGFVNQPRIHLGVSRSSTRIEFFGTRPLDLRRTHSGRSIFTGAPFEKIDACVLRFSSAGELSSSGARECLDTALKRERRYLTSLRQGPEAVTGDPVFDSLFRQIPAISESLMVPDVPGGLRASSMHYWIWGWDTLMCAEAYLLAGQAAFVRDALRFYQETADPEQGIGHQFTPDLKTGMCMAPAAQLLYVIVLYQYGVYTGDHAAWREHFPFARWVFELNRKALSEDGLGIGPALFPDFPEFAGHNGRDISVFNNSLLYQGMRCLEEMAVALDDPETAELARTIARRLETRFLPAFWDRDQGYLVDSIDSETGEQRKSYPAHALLWQTPFLTDLLGGKLAACGRFQVANHAARRGFLMYPRWDAAFNADGNQFAQVWNTHDVFTARCQAAAGNTGLLRQWMENQAWFWEQLTVIEGYSAQTVNDSGTPDLPGGKQAFGARSVYMAMLTGIAGIQFDAGGLTFEAAAGFPLTLRRLQFQRARLNLQILGKGRFLQQLEVKGRRLRGTHKIPRKLLKGSVEVVIKRSRTEPKHPVLLSLYGGEVCDVAVRGRSWRGVLSAGGPCWLRFFAPCAPRVTVDGREAAAEYDAEHHEGRLLLNFASNREMTVCIE